MVVFLLLQQADPYQGTRFFVTEDL